MCTDERKQVCKDLLLQEEGKNQQRATRPVVTAMPAPTSLRTIPLGTPRL